MRRSLQHFIPLLALSTALLNVAYAGNGITITRGAGNSDTGLYFGAGLGNASYDKQNDSSVSYSLFGGLNFNEIFGAELGWSDLGSADSGTSEADVDLFSLGLVGHLPINTYLSAYGQLGFARWNYDQTTTTTSASDSDADVYYGLGIDYSLNSQTNIRFGVNLYTLQPTLSGVKLDEEQIMVPGIGFTYRP